MQKSEQFESGYFTCKIPGRCLQVALLVGNVNKFEYQFQASESRPQQTQSYHPFPASGMAS